MEDNRLIHLLKQKDTKAQKLLYNKYVGAIYAYANRFMSNNQDAEEITTDVFIKAFDKIQQYEIQANATLWHWIKKIALNECLMRLRIQQSAIIYTDELAEDWKDESMDAISGMSIQEIQQAIMNLPIGYRTVFNLFIMESMTHKEIAKKLEISEQTSKSQLFKAKKALKEILQDKY